MVVALDDVIDIDMAPTAGVEVDDLDASEVADELGHIPRVPVEPFGAAWTVVGAGGGADDFAVDEKIDTGLSRIFPAAE